MINIGLFGFAVKTKDFLPPQFEPVKTSKVQPARIAIDSASLFKSCKIIDYTRITALRAYARPLRGKMYVARFARLGGCLINVARCARWVALPWLFGYPNSPKVFQLHLGENHSQQLSAS